MNFFIWSFIYEIVIKLEYSFKINGYKYKNVIRPQNEWLDLVSDKSPSGVLKLEIQSKELWV